MHSFGASGKIADVYKKFDINAETVVALRTKRWRRFPLVDIKGSWCRQSRPAAPPLSGAWKVALNWQVVSRLGARVVDAYLKHREAAFQFDRAALCAFLGAELGLQSPIYFDGETGFG
jgi:hypothetical protein